MGEASAWEGRTVVEEIMQSLGDDVAPESKAWWQYLFVVAELGHDSTRQLVREVQAVEAAGGMTTKDLSRRRTAGGVFFVLAYERLGAKRAKSVRWRAGRRFEEAMLRRFLRLLTLVLPASPGLPAASTESTTAASVPPPLEQAAVTAVVTPVPLAPEPAVKTSAAKPARRQEPEVEVLVVRRRPAASASPTAKPRSSPQGTGR